MENKRVNSIKKLCGISLELYTKVHYQDGFICRNCEGRDFKFEGYLLIFRCVSCNNRRSSILRNRLLISDSLFVKRMLLLGYCEVNKFEVSNNLLQVDRGLFSTYVKSWNLLLSNKIRFSIFTELLECLIKLDYFKEYSYLVKKPSNLECNIVSGINECKNNNKRDLRLLFADNGITWVQVEVACNGDLYSFWDSVKKNKLGIDVFDLFFQVANRLNVCGFSGGDLYYVLEFVKIGICKLDAVLLLSYLQIFKDKIVSLYNKTISFLRGFVGKGSVLLKQLLKFFGWRGISLESDGLFNLYLSFCFEKLAANDSLHKSVLDTSALIGKSFYLSDFFSYVNWNGGRQAFADLPWNDVLGGQIKILLKQKKERIQFSKDVNGLVNYNLIDKEFNKEVVKVQKEVIQSYKNKFYI